ncbi:DUF6867 family protein [Pararhodospirillum photometricum]|nr:hypothetical protein [Pararhodospirillum photometricum]
MTSLLGSQPLVFLLFTVGLVGWCAFMTGQALATTWRPAWHALPYGVLMGVADRFFAYALFKSDLLSPTGLVIDATLLTVIILIAYRVTQVHKMVSQYPWLYERTGLFGWREKASGG